MATISQNAPSQPAKIVSQVLADEQSLTHENRSDHREPIVMPAQIRQPKFELTLSGFVRNISSNGVCLIVPQPFSKGSEVSISLFGQITKVECTATCCWSSKFGNTYWISGWQLAKPLPVGRLLKEDLLVEPEQRAKNRVTTAIPVYIKLPNNSNRLSGFTRNLSREGICLVCKTETAVGQLASLEVMNLDGGISVVESRCLWIKRYGEQHWVSGWDFNI